MVNKRYGLTIVLVILTLSIGMTSINSSSSFDEVFALDKKINDIIRKACSAYDVKSNGNKDKALNLIKSCLSNETTLPPSPNEGMAVLISISHLRANGCNFFSHNVLSLMVLLK